MAISKEAYRALEDIVGPENISDDPALLDTYAFQYLAETVRPNHSRFMPRPVAAILPGSTEEVQAIVKTCNRYRIKVKAYSTGWYHFVGAIKPEDDTLQLDMRRMGRILEIDEKNMYAVIEPYVICAQLQSEVMKLGLNINIIGAGASTSILASATSLAGWGPSSFWMGNNSDNLLGLEWVTPAGDIVRTGTLGCGAGWFCGEGPGPSVRGVIRGNFGALGGLGVFTKCAIKLVHWPGPTALDVKGTIPAYRLPVPDNFRVYTLAVPSWEAWADLYYKIYDNEIGYIFHRQFNLAGADLAGAFWLTYNDPTKTLSDLEEMTKKPEIQKLTNELRVSFQLVLAGRSLRDIELQDKILDQILIDVGGWKVKRFCEQDMAELTNLYFARMGHKHLNFVWVGGYMGSWMQGGTPDYVKGYQPIASAQLEREQKSGLLVQSGGDAMMGCGSNLGGGGIIALEQFVCYDSSDHDSTDAVIKHMQDATKIAVSHGYPPGKEMLYLSVGMKDEELYAARRRAPQPFFRYQWKIKQAFDPNNVGDRMYMTLPPEDETTD
jgi:glycolate oxidase